jgi:predicted peptidase
VVFSEMGCLVSIPPNRQRPEEGWPILVFLHGSGEAAARLDLQVAMTRHGPLSKSSGSAATQRFVIIAPQLPGRGGNVWASRGNQVEAIARSAPDKYQGNPSQIYLTGFSYGGNGVLEIGFRQPDVWAALWPVDPTECPLNRAARPIWVSAGEHSRKNILDFCGVWGAVNRPANAPPHRDRVYEDRGLDHVPTATQAYGANSDIYDWLLTHSLP